MGENVREREEDREVKKQICLLFIAELEISVAWGKGFRV